MERHIVADSFCRQSNSRSHWQTGVRWLAVALLLFLSAISLVAPVCLVPHPARGVAARVRWYFCSGQFNADAHTLAAMRDFVMGTGWQAPTVNVVTNLFGLEGADPTASQS